MNYLEYLVGGAVTVIISSVTWLVRRVLTNEKQIALMQAEIRDRDLRRQEDREIMNEIKTDLKEVRRDIIELYKREPEHNHKDN